MSIADDILRFARPEHEARPVPIIGQPKVGEFLLVAQITCTCGKTFLWSGKPTRMTEHQTRVQCECGMIVTMLDWPVYSETGEAIFSMGFRQVKS